MEICFWSIYQNNLEKELPQIMIIQWEYNKWKNENIIMCSLCDQLAKPNQKCERCNIYFYCDRCYDNCSQYCFNCNRTICFLCQIKRRACVDCYYRIYVNTNYN